MAATLDVFVRIDSDDGEKFPLGNVHRETVVDVFVDDYLKKHERLAKLYGEGYRLWHNDAKVPLDITLKHCLSVDSQPALIFILKPLASAPISAGAGASGPMKVTFIDLLKRADPSLIVEEETVLDCARFLPQNFNVIVGTEDATEALRLYRMVETLPKTVTAEDFRFKGYTLMYPPIPFPGVPIFRVARHTDTLLAKALNSKEYERAKAFMKACTLHLPADRGSERINIPHVVPFEVVVSNSKPFIIMQEYTTVLSGFPLLNAAGTEQLFRQILQALNCIHELGFAHCDIKRSNVGMDHGEFFLIDLQSLVRFGHRSESTKGCVPKDLFTKNFHERASKELDYWMLATMIWESSGNADDTIVRKGQSRPASDDRPGLRHRWYSGVGKGVTSVAKEKNNFTTVASPKDFEARTLGKGSCWPTSEQICKDLEADSISGRIPCALWDDLRKLLKE